MCPRDGDGLFDDRRRFRCESKPVEVARIDELGRGDIGPMRQRPRNRAAQIVDEHVVIAYLALRIEQDAVEHIHDRAYFDLETCFLEHLPGEPSLQRLAELEAPPGQTPLPCQW